MVELSKREVDFLKMIFELRKVPKSAILREELERNAVSCGFGAREVIDLSKRLNELELIEMKRDPGGAGQPIPGIACVWLTQRG